MFTCEAALCLFLTVLSVAPSTATFTINFRLPAALRFNDRPQGPIKSFNDTKTTDGSIFMVYHHDLTVAVVELGPRKLLLNCNVIEIYGPSDVGKAMGVLRHQTTPVPISFDEMVHLMDQCQELDVMMRGTSRPQLDNAKNITVKIEEAKAAINNHLVLFNGIVPGTKWCGTGDVAKTYHDLGEDAATDMCCRNHDLCPVKIMSRKTRYDLRNDAIYTKSHCTCDDRFLACMKNQNTKPAQLLGHIYFNIVKVQCVADGKNGKFFRDPKDF